MQSSRLIRDWNHGRGERAKYGEVP